MNETIYFNGKKYKSAAEMPSHIRLMYEKLNRFFLDDNQDGVPDIVQSGGLAGVKETVNMIKDIAQVSSIQGFEAGQISIVRKTDRSIFINGKEYTDSTEMPDYIRQEYERIVNTAQDGAEDIFDESWRPVDRREYFKPHDDEILNRQESRRSSSVDTPIETVDSTGRFILIAVVAVMILGCIGAAWFLFL